MGHWDYRVVHERQLWRIAEVYYDDDDKPKGWCEASVEQDEDDGYMALREDLQRMMDAFDKPAMRVEMDNKLVEVPSDA